MKGRLLQIFVLVSIAIVVMTFGKLGGERVRSQAVRFFSTTYTSGETLDANELYLENRALKKALKEIADGEIEASIFEQKALAQVIYRPYTDWLSSFWIDMGSENGGGLIGLNSPILYRGALLGIVDYVGNKQSRVLLITDPKLKPAVRVARGDPKRFLIVNQIDQLHQILEKPYPFLTQLKAEYLPEGERFLLAKGELQGAIEPRSSALLKGVGFNYETKDKEGLARDLRTGIPYDHPGDPSVSLIQVDDLLVTSGLDGLFPEGLDVALVTEVQPLNESDIAFEIIARPLFGSVEEIREVHVLPPQPYDAADLPPFVLQRKK